MCINITKCVCCVGLALSTQFVENLEQEGTPFAVPSLPPSASLAATLFASDGCWYALGSNEIRCVNKLLQGKPHYSSPGMRTVLPDLTNAIILWGKDGKNLVPTDVIRFDDYILMIVSSKKGKWFEVADLEERKPLVELIKRIKKGTERPVVVREKKEESEKGSSGDSIQENLGFRGSGDSIQWH